MPKAVYVPKSMVDEALATPPTQGKHYLPGFGSFCTETHFPANILEDHHLEVGIPEWHRHEEDLWICLEGSVVFTVNGTGKGVYQKEGDEREWKAATIEGGTEYTLRTGDVLWIPAGVWHMHTTVRTARLFIIKRTVSELAPKPI